ncbi:ATP-binding protein [[Empedobacter] haloabium]|uniref:histidine kinase n=1 Tax=[Empedobacter] haloabium TaxID=592317 RepID=A0ABZ1USE5_9BURK
MWSIHAASEYQQREQERSMLDLARALSSAADAELDGVVATLTGMARTPALAAGDVAAFYAVARLQAATQPEWLSVILTDGNGNMLFRTTAPYGAPAVPIADPASLRQALAVRHAVVGHVARGAGGRVALPVRVPVSDAAGRLYVLTAVIRPDRLLRVIQRQVVPPGAVISVLDSSGLIVARSADHRARVGGPPSPSLTRLLHHPLPEGVGASTTLEGMDVTAAYTRLSRYGWTVAVGTPTALLRSAFLHSFAMYGMGIAGSLAACIALASLLAARMVRATRQLQSAASALGAGAAVSVPPSRIRELRTIGEALTAAARQHTAHEEERSRLLASLREALDQQEQALARAREAGRAKDEFLAVLGHELRNPLSPIVASLDLMDLRDEATTKRERAVLRRQVNHLRRLVDDLLDVSRITSGKLQLELRPVNLADIVRQAVAAFPGQQIALAAPIDVWVRGDDSRLTQVLNNLLSNAARFGGASAQVTLTTTPGHACLTVSDTGVGMSAALLEHVFDPFFQAPQQLARRTGGLGLGLAIVRRIVELHGGRVSAHSAGPGQGSRFEVELPLTQSSASPADSAPHAPMPAQRVLLVDDNEDAAVTSAALLRQIGHDVHVAHSAAEALALGRRHPPAVAILDIGLPDMDGYALAAALREEAGAAPLRLVALTGYGQKADVERARAAGFDVHLTKPASADDLRRALAPAG